MAVDRQRAGARGVALALVGRCRRSRWRRISRASATQRAGRAGRLRPGAACGSTRSTTTTRGRCRTRRRCARLDLAEPMLLLAASGVHVDELDWLEAPPAAAVEAARGAAGAARRARRARRRHRARAAHAALSAASAAGAPARRGRGARRRARRAACVAALVGERELVWQRPRRAELSGDSDLLADLDRFREAARGAAAARSARARSGSTSGAALTIDRRAAAAARPLVERGDAAGRVARTTRAAA